MPSRMPFKPHMFGILIVNYKQFPEISKEGETLLNQIKKNKLSKMPVYRNPTSSMKYNNIFIALWLFLFGSIVVAQKRKTMILVLKRLLWLNLIAPAKSVFKIQTLPEIDDSLVQKIKVDYTFGYLYCPPSSPTKPPLKLQRQESSFYHNSYVMGGSNQSYLQFNLSTMVPLDECNPSV